MLAGGRLRVDVDPFMAELFLADRLGGFMARHPELTLEVIAREKVTDPFADGVDVVMRFGEPAGSAAIAAKILDTRVLTVASPAYLKAHGRPRTPHDLANHQGIHYRDLQTGRPFEWIFIRGTETVAVEAPGRLVLSDVGTKLRACAAGAGVAQVLEVSARAMLDQGQLVELFPDWPGERFPLFALYPSRHHAPAKVRAFIDFVREALPGR